MICISIVDKNPDRIVSMANSSEMAEIRIDLCELDKQSVSYVFSKIKQPTIATCRPEFCEDKLRLELLKTAVKSGATFVDVEIESVDDFKRDIMLEAKSNNCKTIISYHNYKETPLYSELCKIVDEGFAQGADIVKIATTALSQKDCATVLSLYAKYTSLVALAMGSVGKITRMANLYLGSPFSFAAIDAEHATAAGQMTTEQMIACRKLLD